MFEIFIFILFFCLLVEAMPLILELLYMLGMGIIYLYFELLKFMGLVALKILKLAGRYSWALMVFLYYLADEALRSWADHRQDHKDAEAEENAYEQALSLLGLQDHCTKEDLGRAFRSAMARAHPDKGGTHKQAMALNIARNIIKTRKGWR